MKKNAGSPLMQLLKEKNKSTVELAEAMNIRERTVFYWLSGQRIPRFTIAEIYTLCDFLGCSFYELPTDFSRDDSEEQAT